MGDQRAVRVGAIDCGTNSIRLLVADVDPRSGVLTDVLRRMEVVRLGHRVDRTGVIDPVAMERTLGMTLVYAGLCRSLGAARVRFVATSASRDAGNAADFVAGVREAFADYALTPEVISGAEEATLSFAGATGDVAAQGIPGPYVVVDLGGGSTELVRGTGSVEQSRSVDIGCVRMTERHLCSDPPSAEEIVAAARDIDSALEDAAGSVDLTGIRALVGLAGSVTTVTAHALRLARYDPAAIHLSALTPSRVHEAARSLLAMSRADRGSLGFMHPGRVDVIGAGALVWDRVVERAAEESGLGEALPVVTSEHDILDGIALSLVPR